MKKVKKTQPGSSSVHVPATGEEDKILKAKDSELSRAKAADLVTLPENVFGTNCANCKFVNVGKAFCENPKVNQALPKGPSDMCCALWDAPGTLRAWVDDEVKKAFLAEEDLKKDFPEQPVDPGSAEKPVNTGPQEYNSEDPESHAEMYPTLDNLEAGILKAALGEGGENDTDGLYNMQQLIAGTDWEVNHNEGMLADEAKEIALKNLSDDPMHYQKLQIEEKSASDKLYKETGEGQEDPMAGEGVDGAGLHIDLGSGQEREPGHIGFDLYPYDHGTIVHDLNLGIPLPDESVSKVRLAYALHKMDGLSEDPKPLLSEIQRVLMPGGQFTYEGPNDIWNYPQWSEDYPDLVLINHEDNSDGEVEKDDSVFRQTFTRSGQPDPATAEDAEPRIGIPQYDELPADQLLAMDALGYYWSDETSSGKGNRFHGYPSQGAMVAKAKAFVKAGQEAVRKLLTGSDRSPKITINPEVEERMLKSSKVVPIIKADKMKQIVYGTVIPADEIDSQNEFMEPEDIEKTAHQYLKSSRIVGSQHKKPMLADVVESFIAPQDLEWDGQYGPQSVKKGSWVMAVKVNDPKDWQKVLNGEYTGFSVGGKGIRDQM